MLEKHIEQAVCRYAESEGCIVVKLNGPGDRGKPDRMFLRNGVVLFIEFKKPGGRATPLQIKWQERLRASGFVAEFVDTVADGVRLVNRVLLDAGGNAEVRHGASGADLT